MRRRSPLVPALLLSLGVAASAGGAPTSAEQRCVTGLGKAGYKVVVAQNKLQASCVDAGAKGTVTDAAACIAADASGRVAKAATKTRTLQADTCAAPPPIAFAGAAAVNAVGVAQPAGLLADAMDAGTGPSVVRVADDATAALCQRKVLGALQKLLATWVSGFNTCAKTTLKTAPDVTALRDGCLDGLTAARRDPKSRLAKAAAKLAKERGVRCAGVDLAAAWPGTCAGRADAAFDACLADRAACRGCLTLDGVYALGADCDAVDDAAANLSCGVVVTTTTTTSTTTDASTSTTTTTTDASTSTTTTTGPGTTSTTTAETTTTTTVATATSTTVLASTTTTVTTPPPTTTTTTIPPDAWIIAIGDTVANGQPVAGAGNIETPGALDVYAFLAAPGQVIYLDEQAATGTVGVPYALKGPDGATIVDTTLGGSEPGRIALAGGWYTLTVGRGGTTQTGTYQVTIWNVPPDDVFAIALDQTVADGVPGAGAGRIETPGAGDTYTFPAAAGTVIYVDEQALSGTVGVLYTLTDPTNVVLLTTTLGGSEPGRITLPATGTYTLRVGSPNGDATGTYAFRLWTVPADDGFAITLDQTVSAGVPAAGAGTIGIPGARDVYTFAATAGTVIYVDEQALSGTVGILYTLFDPANAVLVNTTLGGSEPGRVTLPATGTYTLRVGSDTVDATGTYAFRLWTVPADETFGITLDQTVSDGVPAAGAGHIERAGVRDVYTFAATAGTVVYVDEQALSGTVGILYTLFDPANAVLVNTTLGGSEPGRVTLPTTGTYTLRVGSDTSDATGTYAFRLWTVPADDAFAIAIGDTVSDGVPGPGAGRIESPGAADVYTFAGTGGQVLQIDELTAGTVVGVVYTLRSPSNVVVLTSSLGGSDPAPVTLPATGTYTLRVGSDSADATGAYGLQIRLAP
jgi:hypothetical protein